MIQKTFDTWLNFIQGKWTKDINVRDFIQNNYSAYDGNSEFLTESTNKTKELFAKINTLDEEERNNGGVLDIDTKTASTIISHKPGYIDKESEVIVGLQTDKPFKRPIHPTGGIRMAESACKAYGFETDPKISEIFHNIRKTHNQGVFDVYTEEMKKARKSGIITGLPDAYGRGRIIGDYRRISLYGVDILIEEKLAEKNYTSDLFMLNDSIRLREELTEQINALNELKEMALSYGYDISKPATNSKEAIQWLYFGYLAAIKEQNGAAMSIGRISTFLDIYIEHDIKNNLITEIEAQELIEQLVLKLRIVKFLRTPEYNQLFSGDPTWVTESIGGISENGKHLVTKTSYRFLHTLTNLGAAPEPNLTILWSRDLPESFKLYCTQISINTSSIQYENDDIMRPDYGDDYAIACCVSAMKVGKQMQFFGARANLAKALLYTINGGLDEKTGLKIADNLEPITDEILDYKTVFDKFDKTLDWLAELYINTLNCIHFMHDKYSYERVQMALHDKDVLRTMACGVAGLSVVTDSLSAIKYAKVTTVKNDAGLVVSYNIEGDYPKYGNDNDDVDNIAVEVVEKFMSKLRMKKTYRDSIPTLSILTITSNVVYGKKTGDTPDGRKAGEPFAPGANPLHGRDTHGAIASLNSVAKIPYSEAQDGISYTFSIVPKALGKDKQTRNKNLVSLLDAYTYKSGHHINVNVFERELLIDAMEHPEKYPQLTIRVSGYAVNFTKLNREQQLDVIYRTFHESM